jgi:hypothetical protein
MQTIQIKKNDDLRLALIRAEEIWDTGNIEELVDLVDNYIGLAMQLPQN